MKLFIFLTTFLSINALASVECFSIAPQGYRIKATATPNEAAHLRVQFQGKDLYSMIAVATADRGGVEYRTPVFTNAKRASAALSFSHHLVANKIFGYFSENSYLPVVPHLKLICRQI